MADEILVLEQRPSDRARRSFRLLLRYSASPRVQDFLGAEVAPTPSSTLPPVVTVRGWITGSELTALDLGDTVFIEEVFLTLQGETDAAAIVRIRDDFYPDHDPVPALRAQWAEAGRKVNA